MVATGQGERGIADLPALKALAAHLAAELRPGDVIGLAGPLGAGKTTLARTLIAALGNHDEVPSPTFNLVLTYATPIAEVWHFDLFRLTAPEEALELGIEDALAEAISLIEWPERLAGLMPAEHLLLRLEALDDGARRRLAWRGAGKRGRALAAVLEAA